MAKVTRAIIVGGGIGGAATALSLARQGIKVMLLGKRTKLVKLARVFSSGRMHSLLWTALAWEVARQRAVLPTTSR